MRPFKTAVTCSALAALAATATPTLASSQWHVCRPVDVAAYASRVHVNCASSAAGGIRYFAVKASNPFSKSFLAIANSALVAGKSLKVMFEASASGNSYGCKSSSCRPAQGIMIFK